MIFSIYYPPRHERRNLKIRIFTSTFRYDLHHIHLVNYYYYNVLLCLAKHYRLYNYDTVYKRHSLFWHVLTVMFPMYFILSLSSVILHHPAALHIVIISFLQSMATAKVFTMVYKDACIMY